MKKQLVAVSAVLVAALLAGCSAGGSGTPSGSNDSSTSGTQSGEKYTIESFQDGKYAGTDEDGYAWTITPQAGTMMSVAVTRDGLPPKLSSGNMKLADSDLVFTVGFNSDGQRVDYQITAADAAPGKPLSATVTKDGADAGSMTLTPTAS